MNRIEWNQKAFKQVTRLPLKDQRRVYSSIDDLKHMPSCKNVKKLVGRSDYRLRVGRYRVIFEYAQQIKIVAIEEVRKRDERTY